MPTENNHKSLLDSLRAHLRGTVLDPGSAAYDKHRRQWNAAVDQSPPAIALCADAEDVATALRIAATENTSVTIRGGGHNVAGRSIRSDALLVDLSGLREVVVNPVTRIAVVQGGALWSDVDAATVQHGLATTGGLISSTGVGGFTLGGGAGWLMRRHGLACDNLVRAHVVLADGRTLFASAHEHPDIFWGLRGGAGGLGAVTSFEYQLHPQHDVLSGLLVYPAAAARSVLRAFRDFAAHAPDEFCGLAALITAPPFPFLDPAWHGKPVLALGICWCGDLEAGVRALEPLRTAHPSLADVVGPHPYAGWQKALDPSAPPGRYQYWKTANYREISDAVLDLIADAGLDLPSPESEIHLQHMGGAVARRPAGDSAFAHREANFFVNILGTTSAAGEFERLRGRVRDLYGRLAVSALPGRLPNFSSAEDFDTDRLLGSDHARKMQELRRRYDPTGRFA